MENLKVLVYGRELTNYQRSLATQEFEKLQRTSKEANQFIIDIAGLLGMDTDGVGYDGLEFSIDDFKEAIRALYSLHGDSSFYSLMDRLQVCIEFKFPELKWSKAHYNRTAFNWVGSTKELEERVLKLEAEMSWNKLALLTD